MAYFTYLSSPKIHAGCCTWQCFAFFVAEQRSTVHAHPSSSPVLRGWALGCSCVTAVVGSAAMNIRVHIMNSRVRAFQVSAQRGIPVSYGSSVTSFLRNLCAVFSRGCTSDIPTGSVPEFLFPHIFSSTCLFLDQFHIRISV